MNDVNPVGLKGVDYLEFTTNTLNSPTFNLFHKLGFEVKSQSEHHKFFTQGQIRFLLSNNPSENSHAKKYFKAHGEGVSKISFKVDDAEKSLAAALKRGAELAEDLKITETEQGLIKTASIKGFGDVLNEFSSRPPESNIKDMTNFSDSEAQKLKTRVSRIDHFTNNVPKGEMNHWADFYERVYGFKETRYFDIKGAKTGLNSKVMQLEDNSVIIPINEPEVENGKSQIQEFLDLHKGAGVQHIALMTPDIISTVSELRSRSIKFLDVPDTYYEAIPSREFTVTEDLKVLNKNKILVDGDDKGYLLQIFSDTYVGPLFFEFIQRKNHWGFGEGNFQALFDAIERDQIKRGYLDQ